MMFHYCYTALTSPSLHRMTMRFLHSLRRNLTKLEKSIIFCHCGVLNLMWLSSLNLLIDCRFMQTQLLISLVTQICQDLLLNVCYLLSLNASQLPLEYWDRIIHQLLNLLHFLVKPQKTPWTRLFILGQRREKIVYWRDNDGYCPITWVYPLFSSTLIMVTDFSIRKNISI